MSEFSLDANVNISIDKLVELSSARHDDISTLIYTAVSLNSPMDELIFLYKYMSSVATKYQAILEYCGFFTNREHVQKYVDMVASVSMATIFEYSKIGYNLPEAIRFFVNQFLKIIYEKSEFSIIISKMLHGPGQVRLKVLIEPILSETERKLSDKDVESSARMMLLILSYFETFDRCISCSIIKSDTWSENSEHIPEIIDDNMFPGLFEQYPAVYKIVFKKRHELLAKLGIASVDVSDNIKLPKEFEDVINEVIEEDPDGIEDLHKTLSNIYDEDEDDEEPEEDLPAADELMHDQFYTKLIEVLYSKITGSNFPTTVSSNDIVKSDVLDTPVYHDTYDIIMAEDFDLWSITKSIKKHYECGDESDFFKPNGTKDDIKKSAAKWGQDVFNAIDKNVIDEIKRKLINQEGRPYYGGILEEIPREKPKDTNDNSSIDISNVQYSIPSDDEGFSKFIFDYHGKDEIQKIIDLSSYITETISLYIKTKDKFNQSVLNKIISSYNKAETEIIDIKNNQRKENYTVQFNMSDKLYRFTISKKDGIIELIECKEE